MKEFNNEFDNNDRNEANRDVNEQNVQNVPNVQNDGKSETVQNDGNLNAPSRADASAQPSAGFYSYTGDRLTENKTEFNAGEQRRGNEDFSASGERRPPVYNMPYQNGGNISYSPNAAGSEKEKTKKARKKAKTVSFTRAGVAVLCCATICLSAAAGFFGAFLVSGKTVETHESDSIVNGGAVSSTDGGPVIYRSVSTSGVGSSQNGNMTYKDVAAIVQDSVVEIVTEYNTVSLWMQYVTSGAGSGVILSEDGYIITNNHVIYNESTDAVADNITVRLRNGEEYQAKLIGTDSDSDIAVLKIEASGLTPAVCGDSDKLAVGEEVIAVGNPLGELGGTVTNGIISATNRAIDMGDVTMNLIQTNAAVNPGNSGGGLFNMSGELIGIVNAKSSGTDIEGLGFAIPVQDALTVAEQLLEYGYVRGKVMIGVTFLDATQDSVARYYGLKSGIYVTSLSEGYNDKNLKPGDRVIAIDGNEVSEYDDITSVVKASSVGDILKFQVYRDGKLIEVNVEVFEKVPDEMEFDDSTEEKTEKEQDDGNGSADAGWSMPWFSGNRSGN